MLRRAFLSYDSHIIFVYTTSLQSNIFFVYALPPSLPPFFILLAIILHLSQSLRRFLFTLSLATFLQQPHMFVTLSFSLIIPFSSSPLPSLSLYFLTVFFNLCHHHFCIPDKSDTFILYPSRVLFSDTFILFPSCPIFSPLGH